MDIVENYLQNTDIFLPFFFSFSTDSLAKGPFVLWQTMDLQEGTVIFVRSIPTCFSQKSQLTLHPICPGLPQRDFSCKAPSELMAGLEPPGPSSQWQRWPNSILLLTSWDDGANAVLCSMTDTHSSFKTSRFRTSVARVALVQKYGTARSEASCLHQGSWESMAEFCYYSTYSIISSHFEHLDTGAQKAAFSKALRMTQAWLSCPLYSCKC